MPGSATWSLKSKGASRREANLYYAKFLVVAAIINVTLRECRFG